VAAERKQEVAELTIEDLIDDVALYCDLTKAKAKKVVYAIFKAMIKELRGGGKVVLKGFGTFKLFTRKARKGWTHFGKYYFTWPEVKIVTFTPGTHIDYMMRHPEMESSA
jgi:DNA-binding protein HU-beta